jgi:PEP-CTERM motif-containing protein
MVVRVTSAASIMALAVAAWPFPAQAQESPTPTIGCTTPNVGALAEVAPSTVSSINWGDGLSLGAPNILVDTVPGVQFNCNGGMYSADVSGKEFSVNFGPTNPSDAFLKLGAEVKWELSGTQEYKEQKVDVQLTVTEFDLVAKVYVKNADGALVLENKDYIVVKMDSAFGDAVSDTNKVFVNEADGSVVLDPPIPGGFGTVELSTTPTATPEPGTLALFGSGLLAAARVLRRKSRR